MEDYQFLPLRDVVFNTLRQSILRGELKPGERLMEISWQISWGYPGRLSGKRFECWNLRGL